MANRFISNKDDFLRKNEGVKDYIQGHMALDIEVAIKTTAGTPVKFGLMKSQVRSFKNALGAWRVEANAEYSAVQEAGRRMSGPGAPTKKFSHYTTAGTSAGWFLRAINGVKGNFDNYVLEARTAFNL